MILLWGVADDPPLRAVGAALDAKGVSYFFVDQQNRPPDAHFQFGSRLAARIGDLDLVEVRAAYIRPQEDLVGDEGQDEVVTDDELVARHVFTFQLSNWLDLAPILVINRLSAQASNTSKLYQQLHIAQSGFKVPQSLASTDADAVRAFIARHRAVIYKSLSSVRECRPAVTAH